MKSIITLRYQLDQNTGQPRLFVPMGVLPNHDVVKLKRELQRNYNLIVRREPKVIRITSALAALPDPVRFRIEIERERDPRCPTLVLYHVGPPKINQDDVTGSATPTMLDVPNSSSQHFSLVHPQAQPN